jgi:hypothetical protein
MPARRRGTRGVPPAANLNPYYFEEFSVKKNKKPITTCNNGSLGSGIDEERSEMRYVM